MRIPLATIVPVLLPLLLAPLVTSCGSNPPKTPAVNNGLLAQLPAESLIQVNSARTLRDQAADSVAAAKLSLQRTALERDIAKVDLEAGKNAMQRAKLARELAQAGGTPEALRKADADIRYRSADLSALKLAVPVASATEARAKMLLGLSEATLERQEAVVSLETARAAKSVNSTVASGIDLVIYLDEVDRLALRVQKAEELVERANDKLAKVSEEYEAAAGLAEQLSPRR